MYFFTKIVQTSAMKVHFQIAECSLSYAKIVQIEDNTRLRPKGSNLQSFIIFAVYPPGNALFFESNAECLQKNINLFGWAGKCLQSFSLEKQQTVNLDVIIVFSLAYVQIKIGNI